MRFSKFILAIILASTVICPTLAQAKQVNCEYKEEAISDSNRVIPLKSMGISITIPTNSRAVAKTDGTIQILTAGVYKVLNCLATHPGASTLGRGFDSIIISKSTARSLYDGKYKSLGENKVLSWTITSNNGSIFYNIKLLIQSPMGLIEINLPSEGPITSDSEVKEQINNLILIANSIHTL